MKIMQPLHVPLIKQHKLTCGPTTLRMVLRYFGKNVPEATIIKHAGGIKKYGVRTIKLSDFARSQGFLIYCHSCNPKLAKNKARIKKPTLASIRAFLDKKLPVILAVNSSRLYDEKHTAAGHFIVITGYKNNTFYYNDPHDGKHHIIQEKRLLSAWTYEITKSSAYILVLQPRTTTASTRSR